VDQEQEQQPRPPSGVSRRRRRRRRPVALVSIWLLAGVIAQGCASNDDTSTDAPAAATSISEAPGPTQPPAPAEDEDATASAPAIATMGTAATAPPAATASPGPARQTDVRVLEHFDLGAVSQRLRTDGRVLFMQQWPGRLVRVDPSTLETHVVHYWNDGEHADVPIFDQAFGGLGFVDGHAAVAVARPAASGSHLLLYETEELAAAGTLVTQVPFARIAPGRDFAATLVPVIASTGLGSVGSTDGSSALELRPSPVDVPVLEPIEVGSLVWAIAPARNRVVAFDVETLAVTHEVEVLAPSSLGHAAGSMWTASAATGELLRIDPASGAIEATIDLGEVTQSVVHTSESRVAVTGLDTATQSWQLSVVDPTAGTIGSTMALGTDPDLAPASAFVGGVLYTLVDGTEMIAIGFDVADTQDEPVARDLGLGPSDDESTVADLVTRALDYAQPFDPATLVDGPTLATTAAEAIAAAGLLGRDHGVVTGVAVDGDRALVSVDIVAEDGTALLTGVLVAAALDGDVWRIERDWFCAAIGEFALECPAP